MHIFIAHAQNGHISTSDLKFDVVIAFFDPKQCENVNDSQNSRQM